MSEDWEARALAAEAEVDRLHNRIAVVFAEGQGEKAEAVAAERARIVAAIREAHKTAPDCCAYDTAARIAEAQP